MSRHPIPAILGLVLIAISPVSVFAQASNDSGGTTRAVYEAATVAFANEAAAAGLFEIEASRIALEKSRNDAARRFAQTMIADHTKAAEELHRTAGTLDLPTTPTSDQQALLDALRQAQGNFDRLYADQQIEAHKQAVALFSRYATTGPNGSLKAFAAKTLPILQHHQQMAGALVESVGKL